jgi:L-histidine Nalpha-methyltransferase
VGDGKKDLMVLNTLIDKSSSLIYFPVDMSPEMLYFGSKYVSDNINNSSIQIYPLQLDFSKPEKLKKLRSMLDAFCENKPIIFSLLGNTVSNFNDDQDLLHNLSSILKVGDCYC